MQRALVLGLDRSRATRHALVLGLDRSRATRHALLLGLHEHVQYRQFGSKFADPGIMLAPQLLDLFVEMGNGPSGFILDEFGTLFQIATNVAHGPLLYCRAVTVALEEPNEHLSTSISVHKSQRRALTEADALCASPGRPDRIVNWYVANERIYASLESMRERIHELTR
jgi:hypothetical protein